MQHECVCVCVCARACASLASKGRQPDPLHCLCEVKSINYISLGSPSKVHNIFGDPQVMCVSTRTEDDISRQTTDNIKVAVGDFLHVLVMFAACGIAELSKHGSQVKEQVLLTDRVPHAASVLLDELHVCFSEELLLGAIVNLGQ